MRQHRDLLPTPLLAHVRQTQCEIFHSGFTHDFDPGSYTESNLHLFCTRAPTRFFRVRRCIKRSLVLLHHRCSSPVLLESFSGTLIGGHAYIRDPIHLFEGHALVIALPPLRRTFSPRGYYFVSPPLPELGAPSGRLPRQEIVLQNFA